ncbi:hypothetical protein JTB14_034164 [Gonioctena quinquepunctata]|nr:hypothetical protein JTB14_034164 [Gonioctena quinquepunctata]
MNTKEVVEFSGEYQFVGSDLPTLLKKKGIPEENIKICAENQPVSINIEVDGDKYTITKKLPSGSHTLEYVIGQFVEDHWPGMITTSLPILEENVLTIESKDQKGIKRQRSYVFNDEGVELIHKSPDGLEGKQMFKRI